MSRRSEHRPPRLARWLASWLVPEEVRDAVLGDLEESYDTLRRSGRGWLSARLWYWRHVVHIDLIRLRSEVRRDRRSARRGGDMRDALVVELRQAVRVFRRSPGFVVAGLLTLSIGIGGTTSIFSLINGLLLRPIPGVQDARTLAVIRASDYGGAFGVSSFMDYRDFAERTRSFSSLAAFKPRQVDASATGTPEPLGAAMVTSSYFGVLGVTPWLGRFFGADVDVGPGEHPEAVLTHGLWTRWFGADPAVLGSSIVLNGRPYTVIGVSPPKFRGSSLTEVPELFVPMTMQAHLMPESGYLLDRRGWGGISIVGRLAEGVTEQAAGAEIAALGGQLSSEYPSTNASRTYAVFGFREAAMPGFLRGPVVQLSLLLGAIVIALLLVVCLNVANLFLARSLKRREELAVRRALGAGRHRVTGQLVMEFMIIALAAGVIGLVLARGLAGALAALPIGVALDVSLDASTVLFAGLVALSCGVLCALVPALTVSGTDPRSAAAPASAMRPRRQRWPSRVLVVGQVTVSVILLFATGLFVRTFAHLASADPGFDATNVLTAEFNPGLQGYDNERIADFYRRLSEAAVALPGVEAVAAADGIPAAGGFGQDGWFFEGADDPAQSSGMFSSTVSTDFFPMFGVPVVAGRGFSSDDTADQPIVVLVNEAGARVVEARTGRPAVGRRVGMSGPDGPFFEIVGVVADTRTGRSLQTSPFVYANHEQILQTGFGGSRMVVMLKASVPAESLVEGFRRAAASVDPNVSAANLGTVEQSLDDLLVADRLTVTMLSAVSGLTLLLVALGLYGLLAYLVTQRTREIGIRVALGAARGSLRGIVLREALGLVGAGVLLGMVGGLGLARLLGNFLAGVEPADPLSLGMGLLGVLLVTLAAAYLPARRATRVDPLVAMRAE